QTAVAGRIGAVDPFRDDTFDAQPTGFFMEARSIANDVIAKSQPRDRAREQGSQSLLALDEWQGGHARAVEIEKGEDNEHQIVCATLIHRGLGPAEGWHAIGTQRAQLTVEICRLHAQETKRFDGKAVAT